MVPIHTHPPSRAYDEGWDRIFGRKVDEARERFLEKPANEAVLEELAASDREKQRAALAELTRLTEEMGGYSTDREKTEISSDDAKQTET